MLAIMQFVFSSIWTWLGTLILLAVAAMWSPISINHNRNAEKDDV